MSHLINLVIITGLAGITALIAASEELIILSIAVALIFCSLLYLIKNSDKKNLVKFVPLLSFLSLICLLALNLVLPAAYAGLPILFYAYEKEYQIWGLLSLLVVPFLPSFNLIALLLLVVNCSLTILLKHLTESYLELKNKYYVTVDRNSLITKTLRDHNEQLLEQREIEKENTVLEERNRIARDIHDNVGHKITSAIVQTGAMEFNSDENQETEIQSLRKTLEDAMEQVRTSVHKLHQESVSIENSLYKLSVDYKFCAVNLIIKIRIEPDNDTHRTLMAIVREALANTARHSNADKITVTIIQVKNYYHLLIADNGDNIINHTSGGMGLLNIEKRTLMLGGSVNISTENGFRIFVRLPVKNNDIDRGN